MTRIALTLAFFSLSIGYARGGIINGDFSQGLTGWTVVGATPYGNGEYDEVWANENFLKIDGWTDIHGQGASPYVEQIFSANAGDTLSFDYSLTSAYSSSSASLEVFYWPYGKLNGIFSNFPGLTPGAKFSAVLPASESGQYGVRIGIRGQRPYSASLAVDNVAVTVVPEPSTLVLGLLTAIALGGAASWRRSLAKRRLDV